MNQFRNNYSTQKTIKQKIKLSLSWNDLNKLMMSNKQDKLTQLSQTKPSWRTRPLIYNQQQKLRPKLPLKTTNDSCTNSKLKTE